MEIRVVVGTDLHVGYRTRLSCEQVQTYHKQV